MSIQINSNPGNLVISNGRVVHYSGSNSASQSSFVGSPKTAQELQKLLNEAQPGLKINLYPTEYIGDLYFNPKIQNVTLSGTNDNEGKCTRIIAQGKGITLSSSNCTVENIHIKSSETTKAENVGIEVNGNLNIFKSLSTDGFATGIEIRGDKNEVFNTAVFGGGNGVLIKGYNNKIKNCSLNDLSKSGIIVDKGQGTDLNNCCISNVTNEALALNVGTSDGKVINCSLNGVVAIRGNNHEFRNSMVAGQLNVLGMGNSFHNSSFSNVFVAEKEANIFGNTSIVKKYLDTIGKL